MQKFISQHKYGYRLLTLFSSKHQICYQQKYRHRIRCPMPMSNLSLVAKNIRARLKLIIKIIYKFHDITVI